MKVAEVTAHAMYFPGIPLFLHHQQVMELEAILVVGQVDLAVQEVLEVHLVQKEHSGSSKEFWRKQITGLISSFDSQV